MMMVVLARVLCIFGRRTRYERRFRWGLRCLRVTAVGLGSFLAVERLFQLRLVTRRRRVAATEGDGRAVLEPTEAARHDLFACAQPLGDNSIFVVLPRNLDLPHLGSVVGPDDVDVGAVRSALHGFGRRYDDALQCVDEKPDVDELPRPELAFVVREISLELDRAGLLIDLVVDDFQRADVEFGLAICRKRVSRRALRCRSLWSASATAAAAA